MQNKLRRPLAGSNGWGATVLLAGMDEFFAQGDREKELEIPVGMLNDRDKVNRLGLATRLRACRSLPPAHNCPPAHVFQGQLADRLHRVHDRPIH